MAQAVLPGMEPNLSQVAALLPGLLATDAGTTLAQTDREFQRDRWEVAEIAAVGLPKARLRRDLGRHHPGISRKRTYMNEFDCAADLCEEKGMVVAAKVLRLIAKHKWLQGGKDVAKIIHDGLTVEWKVRMSAGRITKEQAINIIVTDPMEREYREQNLDHWAASQPELSGDF
jgi:hypothetical protein